MRDPDLHPISALPEGQGCPAADVRIRVEKEQPCCMHYLNTVLNGVETISLWTIPIHAKPFQKYFSGHDNESFDGHWRVAFARFRHHGNICIHPTIFFRTSPLINQPPITLHHLLHKNLMAHLGDPSSRRDRESHTHCSDYCLRPMKRRISPAP